MEEGIVMDGPGESSGVTNGTAYEKGRVAIPKGVQTIVVPKDAKVEKAGEGSIEIFTAKSLRFKGHPPVPMHISKAKDCLGVAFKVESASLVLGTFGEWWSKEGGVSLSILLRVPKSVMVQTRENLSGRKSAAQGEEDMKAVQAKGSYWYGPVSPGKDWTEVKSEPDPKMTAKQP